MKRGCCEWSEMFYTNIKPCNKCACLQVRSISLNVRKNVSLNTLSQDVLLKEFSTISWETPTLPSTRMCKYSLTHATETITILDGSFHKSFLIFSVLWTGSGDPAETLKGWMHLKDRPENSPDFAPCACSCSCWFEEVPILHWSLMCNQQYWLDC